MHQNKKLDKLPPKREKVESLEILRQLSKSSKVLGELKGIAQTMPNQVMLINAVVLQEAKITKQAPRKIRPVDIDSEVRKKMTKA